MVRSEAHGGFETLGNAQRARIVADQSRDLSASIASQPVFSHIFKLANGMANVRS
jgi:hypothetical protein